MTASCLSRTVLAANLNQLEPPALLAAFASDLPLGFALLGSGRITPWLFSAEFDLLTTADPALKQRLARWPLFRYWSRCLRVASAFVGSTVSEYAPLAWQPKPGHWLAALRALCLPQFRLLILKDLPQQSPLLPERDNAYADALVQACLDGGWLLVAGQALAYVPIDFADIDGYLARLSASRRRNLRSKQRSRAGLAIRHLPTGSACYHDEALVDHFYALYQAVYAQSDMHFEHLSRDFFAALLRDGSSGGLVFEYRQDGQLIGWNLCFVHDGKLLDKYIGFQYPNARACNLYFVSWMVNLEYALAQQLTHYVAGWTDPEVKAQLGAQFTFTRHAVYVRNPLLRRLARRFVAHFEKDRIWQAQQ